MIARVTKANRHENFVDGVTTEREKQVDRTMVVLVLLLLWWM